MEMSCALLTYSREPKPVIEDTRVEVIELKYPEEPRPAVVDTMSSRTMNVPELRYPDVPMPAIVDARKVPVRAFVINKVLFTSKLPLDTVIGR